MNMKMGTPADNKMPPPLGLRKFMIITGDGVTEDSQGSQVENMQVLWIGEALTPEHALKECADMWLVDIEDELEEGQTLDDYDVTQLPFENAEIYEIPFPPIYGSLLDAKKR